MSLGLRVRAATATLELARFRFDPNQPRDEEGQWTSGFGGDLDLPDADDDGDGSPAADAVLVRSRDSLEHEFAVFDDPAGEYLRTPGRGVAVRPGFEGSFESPEDLGEKAIHIPVSDIGAVAAAVQTLAALSKTVELSEEDDEARPALMSADRVGDLHIGLFDDPGFVSQSDRFIAIVPDDGTGTPDWDAVSADPGAHLKTIQEGWGEFTDTLRQMGAIRENPKQGLDRKQDKLRLDGRIELQPGERLLGSAKASTGEMAGGDMLLAGVQTPSGKQLHIGIDSFERPGEWDATGTEDDLTTLDSAGMAQLSADIARMLEAGKAHQTAYRKAAKAVDVEIERLEDKIDDTDDPDELDLLREQLQQVEQSYPEPDPMIASGVVPAFDGAGGLAWELWGADDQDGGWYAQMVVRPPGAPADWGISDSSVYFHAGHVDFEARHLRSLQKAADRIMAGGGS